MIVRLVNRAAIIRDPRTKKALPPEGGEVPDSTFWRRRLDQGEVVLVEEKVVLVEEEEKTHDDQLQQHSD